MNLFKSQNFFAVIVILLFSFFAVKPLFHEGFFPMHDDTQIARVYALSEALKGGQFPVRVVDFLGYNLGYTIFNFYAPLAYYVGAAISFLGFSVIASTKIMIGLGIILSGIFMYLLSREFFGKIGGVVAALFYIYAPYHSVNVYVRGAIAELWAYAFIPLAVYGFYKLYKTLGRPYPQNQDSLKGLWKYMTISALGFAGIILSHNLTAMMVTPFILLLLGIFSVSLWRKKLRGKLPYLSMAFVLGLGLSAFYFLPALFEMRYTDVGSILGGGSDFRNHFVCPVQFWYSPWGFGGSEPGCLDGLSFQLGKPHIVMTILAFLSLPVLFKLKKSVALSSLIALIFLAITIFLMLPQSRFIWEALSPMEYFQFPWRFLVLAAFFISFLAGGVVYASSKMGESFIKHNYLMPLLLAGSVFLLFLFYVKLFTPQNYLNNPQRQVSKETIEFEISKISDEYLPEALEEPKKASEVPQERITVIAGEASVTLLSQKAHKITFNVNASTDTTLLIHKASFPAWQVYLNEKPVEIKERNGEMVISVPEGTSTGEIVFEATPVQMIGNVLSFISVVGLGTGIITSRKKRKRE